MYKFTFEIVQFQLILSIYSNLIELFCHYLAIFVITITIHIADKKNYNIYYNTYC